MLSEISKLIDQNTIMLSEILKLLDQNMIMLSEISKMIRSEYDYVISKLFNYMI